MELGQGFLGIGLFHDPSQEYFAMCPDYHALHPSQEYFAMCPDYHALHAPAPTDKKEAKEQVPSSSPANHEDFLDKVGMLAG